MRSNCQAIWKWLNKVCHEIEYYAALKIFKEFLITWEDVQNMLRIQGTPKKIYDMTPVLWVYIYMNTNRENLQGNMLKGTQFSLKNRTSTQCMPTDFSVKSFSESIFME